MRPKTWEMMFILTKWINSEVIHYLGTNVLKYLIVCFATQGPFNYVYIVSLKLPFVQEFVLLNRRKRRRVICWWQFEELHRGKLIAHHFDIELIFTFNSDKNKNDSIDFFNFLLYKFALCILIVD